MCLGVPGQIVAVGNDIHQLAQVDVCGVKRDVNIGLICEGEPADLLGQWVLVHVGFAMSIIDEEEAQATIEALTAMSALEHEVGDFLGINAGADDAVRR
ncbi:hydrogenase 2 accessory protein HypG [Leminorella grimontii]|uniref:Hydrogenase 2 accessory protein HypG n=1 Tax=Leminorella grimontii TaxID=82981 RepID=A0AAV5N6X1_9GAMM|nr:hydrogenase maturation factor HybG [Leminorella grimontii]KFC92924.1 HybG family [NiFe] hydrogenase metallocenter assembly protein [Leminorella grimontii ATCC 33999 = DSM 5078]GKX56809.1 hydrogenase 2 accessory protein HypG [Leminorella grimontii]GKX60675.1 hydrogenase 2 accessory protein HypG [Leminorella grimontii]VFS62343.1 Hydrogenase isoenzymes formation protein hypC [Leminorella grimontii]